MGSGKLYITPSKLHQFAFCPRQVFFDHYLKVKKPLRQRIRMWIGKLLHFFHHLLRPGYTKEQLMQVEVADMGIVLVGKPDAYKDDGDTIIIEEFKSTKMPRSPNSWGVNAWESDMVQALAYAFMLRRLTGKEPLIIIRYINGAVQVPYNEAILMRYLEQYRKMVEYGIFPETVRNRRCSRCIYRELCDALDGGG